MSMKLAPKLPVVMVAEAEAEEVVLVVVAVAVVAVVVAVVADVGTNNPVLSKIGYTLLLFQLHSSVITADSSACADFLSQKPIVAMLLY